ncbi:MAG: AgmX/PglI C-terminal domain-containing protein [Bradymonadaceae bacterium]
MWRLILLLALMSLATSCASGPQIIGSDDLPDASCRGAESCYKAGINLRTAEDDDLLQAASSFLKACRKGHAPACLQFFNVEKERRPLFESSDEARLLLDYACEHGVGESCYVAGRQFGDADSSAADQKQALSLFIKGCGADHGLSCFVAGSHFDPAYSTIQTPNSARAAKAYFRACRLGEAGGCYRTGVLKSQGVELSETSWTGDRLIERACSHGYAQACEHPKVMFTARFHAAIRARQADLDRCFDAVIDAEPADTWGTLHLEFVVNPDDTHHLKARRDFLEEPRLKRCAMEIVETVGLEQRGDFIGTSAVRLSFRGHSLASNVGPKATSVEAYCEREVIRTMVRSESESMRRCFEETLASDREAFGPVVTKWQINHDGSTTVLYLFNGVTKEPEFAACIDKVLGGLEFPPPDPGLCIVNFPFNFSEIEHDVIILRARRGP